jgi:hypothetical protein
MAMTELTPRGPAEIQEIREGLIFMSTNFKAMTDWEKQFYNGVREKNPKYFSDRMLEKLRQAVKRLTKELL